MIHVFHPPSGKSQSFTSYTELLDYLMDIENAKLLESHSQFGQSTWSFTVYSPERTLELFQNLDRYYAEDALKKVHQKGYSLLEICLGKYKNPTYVTIAEGTDMAEHKKNWCEQYCSAHNYRLKETLSPSRQDKEQMKKDKANNKK